MHFLWSDVVGADLYYLGMSDSSNSRPVHPVVAALTAVGDALDGAVDAAVFALDDDDLEAALERCEQVLARQAELRMRLVAEADGRDLGRRVGAASTASWLRGRFRVRPGQARSLVDAANRIAAAAAPPVDYAANVGSARTGRKMPATGTALAAGSLSEAHAVVIARAMHDLPDGVDVEVGAEIGRQLAGLAAHYDPAELGKVAGVIVDAHTDDTLDDDEDAAVARRELRLSEHTGTISGRLDPEAMAMVRAMLDPLAAPRPADGDGVRDERPYPKRLADALVEITRRVLGHTDWLPGQHGTRPRLNIVTRLNPDQPDPQGMDGGSANGRPRLGRGEPTWGRPLSAATVGRLACDAGITWIITDPAGVPLNVGREQRTVTPGQRAALIVRDGGCAFAGCTRSAEWCEAHHITWWRFGGPTDLPNLVLLCSNHHRAIHHHGWNIQLGPDGIPEFIPPAWVDPEQAPRRSTRARYYQNRSP